MPFSFRNTEITDLILVVPEVFRDERGYFLEGYKRSEFHRASLPFDFAQDNISLSKKKVLRGLHFQKDPYAQGKLVSVLKGRVWDVAVDLRQNSPTFKKWVAVELSEENHLMLWIPEGFAHGFVALEDQTIVQYKCTKEYNRESERGIRYDDPELGIDWPVSDPIISTKDQNLPFLKEIVEDLF